MNTECVAEINGIYGPITVPELLIQKIWRQLDFITTKLKTQNGASLEIIYPGKHNLLEGPDFKNAIILINDKKIIGDVEIHFYEQDWISHGHYKNPEFNNVVLHVVLFPSRYDRASIVKQNEEIAETFIMLPFLWQGIEDYMIDDSLRSFDNLNTDNPIIKLGKLSLDKRRIILNQKSYLRWQQKIKNIKTRLDKYGWAETCHQLIMEVLGYNRNRSAMATLAIKHPISNYDLVSLTAENLYNEQQCLWKLSGVRPANHPFIRLSQYRQILKHNSSWPEKLKSQIKLFETDCTNVKTRDFRKLTNMKYIRNCVSEIIFNNAIPGNRLDTIFVDAILALLTCYSKTDLYHYWYHWYSGDCSDTIKISIKEIDVSDGKEYPYCNGIQQGALQLFIENKF